MLKRGWLLVLALVCLAFHLPAQAQPVQLAWRLAALYVPGSAMPEGMEDNTSGMLVSFIDERKSHRYEVQVDPRGEVFLQRTLTAYAKQGAQQVTLGADAILGLIAAQHGQVEVEGIYVLEHEGLLSYMAVYADFNRRYFFRDLYNAQDGEIQHGIMKPLPEDGEGLLGYRQARAAAQSYLPGSKVLDMSLEDIGAGKLYLLTLFHEGLEHRLSMDAGTGRVIGDSARLSHLMVPSDALPASALGGAAHQAGEAQKPGAQQVGKPDVSTSVPALPAQDPPTPSPVPAYDDDDDDDDDDSVSATATPSPTASPAPTASPRPTATPSPTASPAPTASPRPTASPSPTATAAPTASPAPTATAAPTATLAPTATAAPTATLAPTEDPDD